jgi:hypothetical protein
MLESETIQVISLIVQSDAQSAKICVTIDTFDQCLNLYSSCEVENITTSYLHYTQLEFTKPFRNKGFLAMNVMTFMEERVGNMHIIEA